MISPWWAGYRDSQILEVFYSNPLNLWPFPLDLRLTPVRASFSLPGRIPIAVFSSSTKFIIIQRDQPRPNVRQKMKTFEGG
ncbi:hypothetical protein CDAR_488591 [Caerostris darwini]|uniref:Uncharacterized protein n=1 Tax=Caerostris darwini TaxID=1538125 RepID=A0AAV4S621_9ARAC|nr:hypothetical protein CDAR_488591 [Caerostris darwini]